MRTAAVMLVVKDGLILGISRRHDPSKWGLAGGKVEPGEMPKQAAIRETLEETGIRVHECVEIYRREEPPDTPDGEWFYAYCFYATKWFGKPTSSDEGNVKWMTAEELTSDDHGAFAEYNRNTFAKFREMYPDIELKG